MLIASTPSQATAQQAICHHCGLSADKGFTQNTHWFCCGGCAQVYEFLSTHKLEQYYKLDLHAGSPIDANNAQALELLKDDKFVERYVVYRNAQRLKITWSVPNIHCRACVWLLEKLPQLEAGVLEARVDLMRKKIDIVIEAKEQLAFQTSQTLAKLGYTPNLHQLPGREEDHRQHHREEWLKIGVAGFCFGNVMLFSFPEYFGGEELTNNYEKLFRFLNFVLSLPVLLFCSKGILLSGVKSLRLGSIGVDFPIALGIVALFSWSSYEVFSGTGPGYFDSLCSLLFLMLIGRSFQRQSFQNLVFERDEHRFFPLAVTVVQDGVEKNIPLSELKSGQTYRMAHGSMIPTDSQLLSGEASLDYRLVSGESDLQKFSPGERIFAGGMQRGGRLELLALKEVHESSLARIWSHQDTLDPVAGIENLLDRIAKVFTVVILILAVITFFIWKDTSLGRALELSCAVLIVACPCALALSAPLTLSAALRHLSKAGFYLKTAQFIEKFARIDTFVFDKTGTLTCVDRSQGMWMGKSNSKQQDMARACAQNSNHPIAQSIVNSGAPSHLSCVDFQETPGCGMSAMVDGHHVKIGRRTWALDESSPKATTPPEATRSDVKSASDSPQTVLVIDDVLVDDFAERLRWRPGVESILPRLSKLAELHLLSGDNDKDLPRCLKYFAPDNIHFYQSPLQKQEYIQQLRLKGKRVAMVGDGINDALAMKAADLGIAIPVGSGQFSPSSDIIVAENEFLHIEKFLSASKYSIKIVLVCVGISLTYNVFSLTAVMQGWISPLINAIIMPLSSFTVMAISVSLTALMASKVLPPKGA